MKVFNTLLFCGLILFNLLGVFAEDDALLGITIGIVVAAVFLPGMLVVAAVFLWYYITHYTRGFKLKGDRRKYVFSAPEADDEMGDPDSGKWQGFFSREAVEQQDMKMKLKFKKKGGHKYQFHGKGKDVHGKFKIANGWCKVGEETRYAFEKQYDKKGLQSRPPPIEKRRLEYRGVGTPKSMKGTWFFDGFEDDRTYSGTFTLSSIDMMEEMM